MILAISVYMYAAFKDYITTCTCIHIHVHVGIRAHCVGVGELTIR